MYSYILHHQLSTRIGFDEHLKSHTKALHHLAEVWSYTFVGISTLFEECKTIQYSNHQPVNECCLRPVHQSMGEADVVHHLIESIYAAEVLHVDVMYNFPLSLCTSRLRTTSGFGPRVDKPDHLVLRSHHLDEIAIINIFESYVGRAQLHDLHSDDAHLRA